MRNKAGRLIFTLIFFGTQLLKAETTTTNPPPDPNINSDSAVVERSIIQGFMDPFPYDPNDKRDPFRPPIEDKQLPAGALHGPLLPLQRFDLNQLKLMAVIWDVARPKALIKDPEGKTHIIGPNAKIGQKNGYVAVVREGEIVVIETVERDGRLYSTAQVVKISK